MMWFPIYTFIILFYTSEILLAQVPCLAGGNVGYTKDSSTCYSYSIPSSSPVRCKSEERRCIEVLYGQNCVSGSLSVEETASACGAKASNAELVVEENHKDLVHEIPGQMNAIDELCSNPKIKKHERFCASIKERLKEIKEVSKKYSPPADVDCSPIDYTKSQFPLDSRIFAATEQGSLGICYAHAASLLIDAWRFKNSDKKKLEFKTDPLALAINNSKSGPAVKSSTTCYGKTCSKDFEFWFEGGLICDAINSAQKSGVCKLDETRGPDEIREILSNQWKALSGEVEEKNCSETKLSKIASDVRSLLNNYYYGNEFKKIAIDKVNQSCASKGSVMYGEITCTNYAPKSPDHSLDILNDILKKDAMPVGITYCADIFQGGKNNITYSPKFTVTKNCQPHASVVAGRRWNWKAQQCEYMIKNSWGGLPKNYLNATSYRSDGTVWISADDLKTNLILVSQVK